MRYWCFIWMFLWGSLLLGQEGGIITGIVSDAGNGEPMIAVNISVDRRTGTITGEEGEY